MSKFTAPRAQLQSLRKPRNPLVAASLMRSAGRHGPSAKAQRRSDKQSLATLHRSWPMSDQSP